VKGGLPGVGMHKGAVVGKNISYLIGRKAIAKGLQDLRRGYLNNSHTDNQEYFCFYAHFTI